MWKDVVWWGVVWWGVEGCGVKSATILAFDGFFNVDSSRCIERSLKVNLHCDAQQL